MRWALIVPVGLVWSCASEPITCPVDMVAVPAGRFEMGTGDAEIDRLLSSYHGDRSLYEPEFPSHTVELPAFCIDRTEVTQKQYQRFVEATGRERPFVDRDWAAPFNWSDAGPPAGLEQHPVVLVSYFDAEAYCGWAGKALPTEAEWEKAARGSDGRRYPWGDEWDASRLHSAAAWADGELETMERWKTWWESVYRVELRGKTATTAPVSSHPAGASPYGAQDMAGNVFEWVDAWFEAYPGSPYGHPEFGGKYRVVRGGDWYLDRVYTRAAARLRSPPEHKVTTIGFRCVLRD